MNTNANNFLVCSNSECRMVLDRRVNGESLDGVRQILKTCPECGSDWSPESVNINLPQLVETPN
jgi:hypothetical protein